jgi:hypothetical protein
MNLYPHMSNMKSLSHARSRLAWVTGGLVALLAAVTSAHAAQSVILRIEKAPSLSGPWTRLDLNAVPKDPDGNPRLPVDQPGEYYRTHIDLAPSVQAGDPIPLAEVPAEFRGRAQSLLANKLRLNATGPQADPEGWPEDAQIGSFVRPQLAVLGDGSVKPGYFEFKVLRPAVRRADRGGPVTTDPEDGGPLDAGYILISATDDDFPVAEFGTEGPTPCERLALLAKTSRINVVRYGPTFLVAEDEQGRPLASDGATPFKLDAGILALDGAEWRGDSETGLDSVPRGLPRLAVTHYQSYLEFKEDFASNEVYRKLRDIKKARAKMEWDILRGRPPEGVSVPLGQTVRILASLPPTPAPEVSIVTENDDAILRISASTQGGVLLTGVRAGDGTLFVRQGTQEFRFLVKVAGTIGGRSAGDVLNSEFWYAGNWGAQPKYHQLRRDRWCSLVGCGPTAWAMLFAWFERNRGVEQAFRGEGANALPPPDLSTQSNRGQLTAIYDDLHDLCDVICSPFGDEGATYPPDMTDAFKGYTYPPALAQQIGRSWHTNAVTGTWPDAGALRSRDAIKNGYPAVTGLGWMWHYVLAYGYGYEIIDSGVPGYTYTKRYLKCNMGWNGHSPAWYNLGDTFYSANCRVWSGPNAP